MGREELCLSSITWMSIVIPARTLVLEGFLPGSSMECRLPICGALERLPGPYIAFSDAASNSQCLWSDGGIFQKVHKKV